MRRALLIALALCVPASAIANAPTYETTPKWRVGNYAGAGTTVSDATSITTPIAVIVSAANNTGVKLPSCGSLDLGRLQYLLIPAALSGTLKVYPQSTDAWWNSGVAGTAFSVVSSSEGLSAFLFVCIAANTWMPARVSHMDAASSSAAAGYALALAGGLTLSSTATLTFSGATGNNKIALTDALASALDLTEGSNSYLKAVTSNGGEVLLYSKPLKPLIATPVAAAGTTIANCGAIPAGTVAVQVTGADGFTGVCLPTTSSVTTCVRVMSVDPTFALNVYGADADTNPTVNGGAGDAAYTQAPGTSLLYCNSGVAWKSY